MAAWMRSSKPVSGLWSQENHHFSLSVLLPLRCSIYFFVIGCSVLRTGQWLGPLLRQHYWRPLTCAGWAFPRSAWLIFLVWVLLLTTVQDSRPDTHSILFGALACSQLANDRRHSTDGPLYWSSLWQWPRDALGQPDQCQSILENGNHPSSMFTMYSIFYYMVMPQKDFILKS